MIETCVSFLGLNMEEVGENPSEVESQGWDGWGLTQRLAQVNDELISMSAFFLCRNVTGNMCSESSAYLQKPASDK